jgi:hypothetical protein
MCLRVVVAAGWGTQNGYQTSLPILLSDQPLSQIHYLTRLFPGETGHQDLAPSQKGL